MISSAVAAEAKPMPTTNLSEGAKAPDMSVIIASQSKRQVRSRPLQLRGWSPIWVDRTEFCFSSFMGTLRTLPF